MKKILAVLFVFAAFNVLAKYQGKLELVDSTELLTNQQAYLVLDTRSKQEFDAGHIAGAINIPHDLVADNLSQLKETDKTIVVHCRSGRRALTAEQALLDAGFTNLKHLKGDMKGWQANNLPLVVNQTK